MRNFRHYGIAALLFMPSLAVAETPVWKATMTVGSWTSYCYENGEESGSYPSFGYYPRDGAGNLTDTGIEWNGHSISLTDLSIVGDASKSECGLSGFMALGLGGSSSALPDDPKLPFTLRVNGESYDFGARSERQDGG